MNPKNRPPKDLSKLEEMEAGKLLTRASQILDSITHSPRLSATDLARMVVCKRKVYLKYYGNTDERVPVSPMQQAIQASGVVHEETVVDPSSFTQIPTKDLGDGADKTLAAMKTGVEKIYQGVLRSDIIQGRPDLLIRVEQPSRLGEHHYYPVEIKLGQQVKEEHRLQVMAYLHLLKQIQGIETAGIIQLGDETEHPVHLAPEFDKWLRQAQLVASGQVEPPPFIAAYCNRCEWQAHCRKLAEDHRDISVIHGMSHPVRAVLRQEGISTLHDLATVEPDNLLHLRGVGKKTSRKFVHQARAYLGNEAICFGNFQIPDAPTETYFDVESMQVGGFGQGETRYYLLGWGTRRRGETDFVYEYELAEHPDQEAEIWERFLARIDATEGPVYHYSGYEKSTINQLCQRYGDDNRAMRLSNRLVDLLAIISNNLALPLKSYSIKAVAPWLGYQWTGNTQTAADTMIEYANWLRNQNRVHLDNILVYNKHDCRAMVVIKDWLLTILDGQS